MIFINTAYVKELKKLVLNMKKNRKHLSVDIKLPTNQKDDAKKVKDYIYERIGK